MKGSALLRVRMGHVAAPGALDLFSSGAMIFRARPLLPESAETTSTSSAKKHRSSSSQGTKEGPPGKSLEKEPVPFEGGRNPWLRRCGDLGRLGPKRKRFRPNGKRESGKCNDSGPDGFFFFSRGGVPRCSVTLGTNAPFIGICGATSSVAILIATNSSGRRVNPPRRWKTRVM